MLLTGPRVFSQTPTAPPALDKTQLDAELAAVDTDSTLDEPTRASVRESLLAASTSLNRAADLERERAELDKAVREAPAELADAQQKLAETLTTSFPKSEDGAEVRYPSLPLEELETRRNTVTSELAAARERQAALKPEPERREQRRREIPTELAKIATEIDAARRALETAAPDGENPRATFARRAASTARWIKLDAEKKKLDAELEKYDKRRELLTVRLQDFNRRVPFLENEAKLWEEAVTQERARMARIEARAKKEQAAEAARQHPLLAVIAERVAALAAERTGKDRAPQNRADRYARRTSEVGAIASILKERLESMQARDAELEGWEEDASILRAEKKLLAGDEWRVELERLRTDVNRAQSKLLDYERRLIEFGNIDTRVAEITSLPAYVDSKSQYSEEILAAFPQQAKELLEQERDFLEKLTKEYDALITSGIDLRTQLINAIDYSDRYDAELTAKLVWQRSEDALQVDSLLQAGREVRDLIEPGTWSSFLQGLLQDLKSTPTRWALAVLFAIAILVSRRPVRRQVQHLSERVSSWQTDSFSLTVRAVLLVTANASSYPLILTLIGWLLSEARPLARIEGFDLAQGAFEAAAVWFTLNLVRRFVRPGGVCEVHFRWSSAALKPFYRHTHWFMLLAVPLTFLFVAIQSDDLTPLARLLFVAVVLSFAVFFAIVLRPAGPVLRGVLQRNRGGWLDRLRFVWYGLAVLYPVVVAGLA
ncbi:MAG: hypothetical protein KDC38_09910, partial [Planctomycetes bacterium]|nr:hypothetical protein [Planctomycetota bacterium]